VTRVRWSPNGLCLAATDAGGGLWMWGVTVPQQATVALRPLSKRAADVVFLNQYSVLAVVGSGAPATAPVFPGHATSASGYRGGGPGSAAAAAAGVLGGNPFLPCVVPATPALGKGLGPSTAIVDVRLPPRVSTVVSATLHSGVALCCAYDAASQTLLSGGEHGDLACFDLRRAMLRARLEPGAAHDRAIRAMALDPSGAFFATGSTDGDVKIWPLPDPSAGPAATLARLHPEHTFMNHRLADSMLARYGVTDVLLTRDQLFTCGANGLVLSIPKVWSAH
jgi:hypothetical protein